MQSRPWSILLVVTVALQTILGSGLAICLGHDHEDVAGTTCECDHDAGRPVPIDDHDDDCDCTDLEVAAIDASAAPRMSSSGAEPVAASPLGVISDAGVSTADPAPPRRVDPDSGGRHHLVVVRCTRLIV